MGWSVSEKGKASESWKVFERGKVECPGKKRDRENHNRAEERSDGKGKRRGLGFLTHKEGQSERWEGESVLGMGKGNKAILRGGACPPL